MENNETPFSKEVLFKAGDSAVERFIKEKFPNMPCYEVACYEEQSNDTSMTISVGKYDWSFDESDKEALQKCIDEGKWSNFMLGNILNYLHTVGVLEKGDYLIEISW